jgi:3',5'-cyclic AMP phosphodiesterase CpdA
MKISGGNGRLFRKQSGHLLLLALLSLSVTLGGCKDTNSSSFSADNQQPNDLKPVSFWVATDVHYLDKALQDGGTAFQSYVTAGDGKMLPYSDELAESLVNDIKQQRPKFLILSGDLTNNGERSSHQELTKKLKAIEKLGTAVYAIPGNHDLFNPWARGFKGDKQVLAESITDQDFLSMYADFGYEEAVSRDKDTLSYAVRAAPNLWLLMIDSNQYINNSKYGFPQTDGRVAPSTLAWINECSKLAAKEKASVITVMHHNLLNHTSIPVSGFKVNNSQETMKTLRKNGLNLVLSGHIHMQDIRRDPAVDNRKEASASAEPAMPVYDIATSAFAVNPHQYGTLTFDPLSRAVSYHTASVDVEGWAKASHSTDPNLLGFKTYAEDTFLKSSSNKVLARLEDSSFTETEKASMAEAMSRLNVRYFSGTAGSDISDIKALPGFRLWEGITDGGFMSGYVQSMAEPKEQSNVSLNMTLTTEGVKE